MEMKSINSKDKVRFKQPLQHVLDGLNRVYKDKGYSNLTLDSIITSEEFNKKDIRFVTALFYGVLDRSITLDHIINRYSNKPINRLDVEVQNILRMGVYQLIYMNSVPDNAAVDESVKLCMYAKKTSAKGFVNAVLRQFIRDEKAVIFDEDVSESYKLSVELSLPIYIINLWTKQYGKEEMIKIANTFTQTPSVTLSTNLLKITTQELVEALAKEGIETTLDSRQSHTIMLSKGENIRGLKAYKAGLFHVQDTSSAFCASVVADSARKCSDSSDSPVIFDLCAAPGGKSVTVAQLLGDKCIIKAFDMFEHKIELINATKSRLDIQSIEAKIGNATVYNEDIGMADVVLCDVPCSGFGIIKRKPEIKLKPQSELKDLPKLQLDILQNGARYVKENGYIIYSTCTINKLENNEVCNLFLSKNPNFEVAPIENNFCECDKKGYVTLLPHITNTDGFFVARFKRIK